MPVRVSTGLPNCREGRQNPIGSVNLDVILQIARVADELGYYSLWPNEFVVSDASVSNRYVEVPTLFDTVITMAYVMAATERIRVTPSTIVLPHHEPLALSRQVATLDVFSGGRVTLGIGLGGAADEFRRLHQTIERPNRGKMMDEYVAAMRAIWAEDAATFNGKYVGFADVEILPKPVQRPLPIFMAGHAEGVFRRLAAYGQGWIDSSTLPDGIHENISTLRGYFSEAGRDGGLIEVARQFYVSIAPTEEEAKEIHSAAVPAPTRPQSEGSGGRAPARADQERSLIGTPDQIRARLQEYVAAGVTELCVIFYHADGDSAERQLRLFADEVMPAL